MKPALSYIKKHFEKLLLLFLLIILAICSVYQIATMERPDLTFLKPENEGEIIEEYEIPVIDKHVIQLNDGTSRPYTGDYFVYCRRKSCKYLIANTESKCPWCGTDTIHKDIIDENRDSDNDGMTDKFEITYGLDPNDPKDAFLDKDKDGFTNIEEHNKESLVNDPLSHPSLITKTKLWRVENIYYPFSVTTIDTGQYNPEKDPSDLKKRTWDIYADIYVNNRRRSRYYKLNETDQITGYQVIEVGLEENKPYAVFKKGDEPPVKFYADKKRKFKEKFCLIKNVLNEKSYKVKIGNSFKMSSLNGKLENFKLLDLDLLNKKALIRDYQTSKDTQVGTKEELPKREDQDLIKLSH